ncbi:Cyclic nucleotide-binding domain-containing protein [Candidatus Kryptonium thompsonii]|jgi:CRP-like cAMP-binding protein|uniref:Cyclic nucleotide-binding domain-containing protein n=1 Tax=Candidatus Kryptonium thompsonii TaxID=1633631 RepID=A0A0P1LQY5_9BACT|nr:cyclic nucleotide-binding domain-containing protein [Candidatus Kryptonium thompsoni]CUS80815.1 Cyclic nucleotide-binding domain-containing protein [Candidatus Kryptonium thompsoni]CUS84118.1 Cyclic nucleotide-binding domain-containing protein [Candidatus Kryptonium thompsoni]CUS84478.1 Cyclic nucleotide-binding domain-containing protein [Candidatus Kryptonium thompsoni]CUS86267.1 Cyclic nucleotide-binding domain-containing protein [Candidatus Kryptonium thompsoni]CUS90031.1 Cyclic nucleoti
MAVETLERLLAEHPFFKDLKKDYLSFIVGCARNAFYKPGEFIFREGEEAQEFYLIRDGKVALEISFPGKKPVIIQTLESGEVLGWSWITPPYYWHFDARVVEPTRAIAFDGKCLRNKCEEDHSLGYEILKRFITVVEQRLQATRIQLLDLYGAS